jgi:recombinational DNA repair protein (RecF pathway)
VPARLDADTAISIMRKAGVEPAEPYQNSAVPWRCRCRCRTCGREVTPRLTNVRAGHAACAYCAGLAVDPDEAAAVMRAAGLEPVGPYPGSARPWLCRCTRCGRESKPRYATVSMGTGCRYCGGERIRQALRLDADQAAATMREAGLEPLGAYPGAGSPWRCRCTGCGREVTPRYTDVRGGHAGCKWCAWQANAVRLRMDHETAAVLMIEHGLEPLEPYPGAGRRWRCRCLRCGSEVMPRYSNIKQGWGGCRTCWRAESSARQRGPEADAIEVMRAAGLDVGAPRTWSP